MTANPWVRPYVLTAGRTRTRHRLFVETLVSVPYYDPHLASSLMPESRALYEWARRTMSVAELSAHASIALGVTRVLISDLAAQQLVTIHGTVHTERHDIPLPVLERIRNGLAAL